MKKKPEKKKKEHEAAIEHAKKLAKDFEKKLKKRKIYNRSGI